MRQATLIRGSNPWKLGNLRGLDYQELSSVIQQTLDTPGCPDRILLLDLGEQWNYADLTNEQARLLLWNRL